MKGSTKLWIAVGIVTVTLIGILYGQAIWNWTVSVWPTIAVVYTALSSIMTLHLMEEYNEEWWIYTISPIGWLIGVFVGVCCIIAGIVMGVIWIVKHINKWADKTLDL